MEKMRTKTMNIMSVILLALAIFSGSIHAQAAPAISSISVKKIEINDRTMNILPALAKKYKVVIGVHGVFIGEDSQKVSISLSSGTLKEVLDAIVSQDTRFEWRQDDNGGIHFSFRNSPLALAAITVPSFDIENPKRMVTVELLSHIPEIQTWLRQQSCSMDEMIVGYLPHEWEHFSVHTRDSPFASVLDEIAASSKTYFWSAIQYSAKPCMINVTF